MNRFPDRPRPRLAACLLALATGSVAQDAPPPAATPVPPTQAAEAPPADTPPTVTPWHDVASSPCRFHGEEVRVRIQVRGAVERWSAGPTRFGPGAFACVSAWSDEQWPWVQEQYENPAVRVFVRRGSAVEKRLAGARAHQRFEVRGVVREVWRDRPWIELVAAEPLEEEVGEATVIHAARALELMESEAWPLADAELEQALSAPLPQPAADELRRLRAECAEHLPPPQPPPAR